MYNASIINYDMDYRLLKLAKHAAHAIYKMMLNTKPIIESTRPAVATDLPCVFFLPSAPSTIPIIPRIAPSQPKTPALNKPITVARIPILMMLLPWFLLKFKNSFIKINIL